MDAPIKVLVAGDANGPRPPLRARGDDQASTARSPACSASATSSGPTRRRRSRRTPTRRRRCPPTSSAPPRCPTASRCRPASSGSARRASARSTACRWRTRRRAPTARRRRRCARRRRRPASSASTSSSRPSGRAASSGSWPTVRLDAARCLAAHGADALLPPARQVRCRPTCCPRPTCPRWARRRSPSSRRDAPALPLRRHRGQWYQRPPHRQGARCAHVCRLLAMAKVQEDKKQKCVLRV